MKMLNPSFECLRFAQIQVIYNNKDNVKVFQLDNRGRLLTKFAKLRRRNIRNVNFGSDSKMSMIKYFPVPELKSNNSSDEEEENSVSFEEDDEQHKKKVNIHINEKFHPDQKNEDKQTEICNDYRYNNINNYENESQDEDCDLKLMQSLNDGWSDFLIYL